MSARSAQVLSFPCEWARSSGCHSEPSKVWVVVCVALLLTLWGLAGCVVSAIKQHDLADYGLPALIVERGQELHWPLLTEAGSNTRVDPPPRVGAAVIVWSSERPGARSRAASVAKWLISDARLPAHRVSVISAEQTTRPRLISEIAHAATVADPSGSLILVFIGEGMSHPVARAERFMIGDGSFVTQDDVINAVLLGPRWLRTLAVWDACWDSPRDAIPEGWQAGIYPRTYMMDGGSGRQRRAKITTISAGLGLHCVKGLPGDGGPAIAYLTLAGLTGWSDSSGEGRVEGPELGASVRWWTESVVTERDAVRAWMSGRPARSASSAAFVAVRGNAHAFGAREPAPDVAALLGENQAPEEHTMHRWAGGAVIRPPSTPGWAKHSADEDLARVATLTREGAAPPTRIAELWCDPVLAGRHSAAAWECDRWKAYADRWRRFLPILDRDAAMLRDAIRSASRLGDSARQEARALLSSFLATYAAYPDHPKVRALRALIESEMRREAARIATRGPMVEIRQGQFAMGCRDDEGSTCEADEQPVRRVYLSKFAIQEYEVSHLDYDHCVMSEKCTPLDWANCYSYTSDTGFGRRENAPARPRDLDLPVTCVTWEQAHDYCRWAGGRLPTEAEWEKAARGTAPRRFPWSPEDGASEDPVDVSCERANHFDCGEALLPVEATLGGRSPFGIAHLAGNAAEWVADFYGPYKGTFNPQGPRRGRLRSIRGGSFVQPAQDLRTSYRYALSPQYGYEFVGFRCAAKE